MEICPASWNLLCAKFGSPQLVFCMCQEVNKEIESLVFKSLRTVTSSHGAGYFEGYCPPSFPMVFKSLVGPTELSKCDKVGCPSENKVIFETFCWRFWVGCLDMKVF
jgi:hypothetical protein